MKPVQQLLFEFSEWTDQPGIRDNDKLSHDDLSKMFLAEFPQPVTINLNDQVWMKLTGWGWDHFNKYHRSIGVSPEKYAALVQQPSGWQKMSLWEFIHQVGSGVYMGSRAVVEDNTIYFSDPAPLVENERAETPSHE